MAHRSIPVNVCRPPGIGTMDAMDVTPVGPCCTPIGDAVLSEAEAVELATAFKVMADPVRLRLLSMIATADEACACDLTEPLGRSQPTISHHLALLTDAGLVTREKRGKWAWYRIVPERLEGLRAALTPSDASSG